MKLPANSTRIAVLVALTMVTGCAKTVVKKDEPFKAMYARDCIAVVDVLFATDRVLEGKSGFGDLADESLRGPESFHTGKVRVVVPGCHRDGLVRGKSWYRLFRNDDEVQREFGRGAPRQMWSLREARRHWNRDEREHVAVFIHGFNNTFEEAAQRAALISDILQLDGPTYLFSWASAGSEQGYIEDSDRVRRATPRVRAFLEKVLKDSGAKKVHLLAHSMGNRALVDSLSELVKNKRLRGKIGKVVMLAPDVDTYRFEKDLVSKLAEAGLDMTLYASARDVALKISGQARIHARRLGAAGKDLYLRQGLHTIDTTECAEGCVLCHDLFSIPCVASDLPRLIKEQPGKRRYKLKKKGGLRWWELKAD